MPSLIGRRLPVVALLLWQAGALPAAQAPQAPQELQALADSSALAVTGRVAAISVQGDGSAIYTYVTVAVAQIIKGSHLALDLGTPPLLVVKQMGGVLRDVGLQVAGQASFTLDEEVLLFLSIRPRDRTLYSTGLARGKWSITGSPGGGTAAQGDEAYPLDDLRRLLQSSVAHGGSIIAVPPEILIARPFYSFLPASDGGPARWHEVDDGATISVDYQNVPGGLPGGVAELDGAIGAWNGVNTRLGLARGGSGNAVCPASNFTGSGRIALYWNDPCGEISDADSATFGVGGGYFTSGFQKTINGTTFNKFLQGLAIINNNSGPHLTHAACLRDAVTHVLGHAVGLGHSSDGDAVMFATLRSGCTSGTSGLGSDDIAGLQAIYPPIASGGFPPLAPTGITSTVVLDTVTLNWTPATTGGPAQSYTVEAGSASGLANLANIVSNGTGTTMTVGAVPSGVYYVRVRARNALGTSSASPETTVTVGPCSAPGTPMNLAALVGDNNVTLTWTAPATGVTQGYTLFAGTAPGLSNALVQPLTSTPSFSGAAPFGNYYVRVAARNSCSTGPQTADVLVSVQPCTAAPAAPTNLTFSRNGNIVTLAWIPPAGPSGAARYVLFVGSTAGGSNVLVHATPTNAPTFSAFAPTGTYFVRVQGQNACGSSGPSNEVQIAVP